ncbi:MAG: GNAT family N-acetyltransferase [Planctomycetota bacterium]|nr:GNAT family N-acetyltransferase [Planctomycetota bacterium]
MLGGAVGAGDEHRTLAARAIAARGYHPFVPADPHPVRRLTPDDIHAYIAIRRAMLLNAPWAFGASPEDDLGSNADEMSRALADAAEECILAVDHPTNPDELIAVAGVRRAPKLKSRHRAWIWGVYVHPDHRAKGLGRAVTQAAIEAARNWPEVEVLSLSASINSPAAIALYESLGFQRWGVEPDATRVGGKSYDEVFMSMTLR